MSDERVPVLETSLADEVSRLLAQTPPAVVAHSHRSYHFAAAFAAADGSRARRRGALPRHRPARHRPVTGG